MDRAKVKALLESGVLQAYAEGRDIQLLNVFGGWEDMEPDDFLLFSLNADQYRVKPEPLHDWAVHLRDGSWRVWNSVTESGIKQYAELNNAIGYRQLVPVTEEK